MKDIDYIDKTYEEKAQAYLPVYLQNTKIEALLKEIGKKYDEWIIEQNKHLFLGYPEDGQDITDGNNNRIILDWLGNVYGLTRPLNYLFTNDTFIWDDTSFGYWDEKEWGASRGEILDKLSDKIYKKLLTIWNNFSFTLEQLYEFYAILLEQPIIELPDGTKEFPTLEIEFLPHPLRYFDLKIINFIPSIIDNFLLNEFRYFPNLYQLNMVVTK